MSDDNLHIELAELKSLMLSFADHQEALTKIVGDRLNRHEDEADQRFHGDFTQYTGDASRDSWGNITNRDIGETPEWSPEEVARYGRT